MSIIVSFIDLRHVIQLTRNNFLTAATLRCVRWRFLLALSLGVATMSAAQEGDLPAAARLEETAAAETDAGQYAAAARHATEAAAIYSAHNETARRASAVNRAGLAWLYAGDYPAALRSFTTATRLSASAGADAGLAEQLTNLGNVHYFVGRYADAAASYDRALAVTKRHGEEPWTARRRRIIVVNQATLQQRLGRDEEALALYRVAQSGGDLRPREQAQILANLGVLYRRLGDPVKAVATYDDARRLFAQEHHLDGELGVMKNRGIALALDLHQLDAALSTFSEALGRAMAAGNRREMLQAQLYRGESEFRLGRLEPARGDFVASLEAARALRTPEEEWKALYGLARVESQSGQPAAAHLEQAVRVIESLRVAIRVPTLRSDFFNDKREVYDRLIAVELERGDATRVFDLIERSQSRVWRDRLGLMRPVTLDAVRRALPADVLLLDTWSSPSSSAVVAVTREGAELKRITVDSSAVKTLSDALATAGSTAWRNAAASIAPSLRLPKGIRHVVVVADGPLALVPFELLPVDGRMLIEQAAVSYIPTAAMLFRPAPSRAALRPPWTLTLRGFGDPRFGSAALEDPATVRNLPSSAGEVRGIAAQLGGRSVMHLGADDRKAYLYEASEAPILHLATHAVADTDALERSRILFSPARDSGADYLFLKEAYDLPLRNVELAVLSACDTERGRLVRGEGVQSFSRAFLAAGARSTVTTLWRVPDGPTAAFMKVFYHHLQRGASRDDALRQAKLRFLRSGSGLSEPHYWAAFVLSGEGVGPVPLAVRWSSVALVAGMVVAMALLLAWGARLRRHRPAQRVRATTGRRE